MINSEGQMLAEVSVLKVQVKHLTDMMEKQNLVLAQQNLVLQELTALANRGKGSLWMFITLGGIMGAVLSNAKAFFGLFIH